MLESLSSLVCNFWEKRKLYINTYFVVTGWVLCLIPHIKKYASDHSDIDNSKQVNSIINTLFHGLSAYGFNFTLNLFWDDYTDLDNNKWFIW